MRYGIDISFAAVFYKQIRMFMYLNRNLFYNK